MAGENGKISWQTVGTIVSLVAMLVGLGIALGTNKTTLTGHSKSITGLEEQCKEALGERREIISRLDKMDGTLDLILKEVRAEH